MEKILAMLPELFVNKSSTHLSLSLMLLKHKRILNI